MTRRASVHDERGAAALEVAVLVPGVMLLLGLMMAGGRVWFAHAAVTEAAQAGARAATLARTAEQASSQARQAVGAALSTGGVRCERVSLSLTVAEAFAQRAGTPATVRSTIVCVIPLADLALPGLAGEITVTGSGAAALDTYRART